MTYDIATLSVLRMFEWFDFQMFIFCNVRLLNCFFNNAEIKVYDLCISFFNKQLMIFY